MSEYKVGDKVRIVKSDRGYSEDFTGQECFVVRVDESGVDLQITYECGDFNTLYFTNEEVEPVGNKTTEPKWTKWDGKGDMPVTAGTKIKVKYRGDNNQDKVSLAGDVYSRFWDHWGGNSDIVAYYVIEDVVKDVEETEERLWGTPLLHSHFKLLVPEENSATATDILQEATECLTARAVERDREGGERSMRSAVEAFNALTGHELTEADGWLAMVCLKAARAEGGKFRLDDYIDGAAYFALYGEAASKQNDIRI